jgi:hypothetical protein
VGRIVDWLRAPALFRNAEKAAKAGEHDAAIEAYREYVAINPRSEAAWFNLGLEYKRLRDWENSARCNRQAVELKPTPRQPAWWNLGIAATALRDWPTARAAWRGYGVKLPDGEGPIDLDLGLAPVQMNDADRPFLVWCRRVDPARAVIARIPPPKSAYHWGDCILHDGEPKGTTRAQHRVFDIFEELECWQPSGLPTIKVTVNAPSSEDADALTDGFTRLGLGAEDWTRSLLNQCTACAENVPHERHDESVATDWQPERNFALAAPLAKAQELLDEWIAAGAGRAAGEAQLAA